MNRLSAADKRRILRAVSMTTKRNGAVGLIIIFIVLLLGLAGNSGNGTLEHAADTTGPYRVVRVIDGDTIVVDKAENTETVRLIGVDTPEVDSPITTAECFGEEASAFTRTLIEGEMVLLESDASQDNRDRFGRLLRYVYFGNTNINKLLIEEGYALEYTFRVPYKYQQEFIDAQDTARDNGAGLWSDATCGGSVAADEIEFEKIDNTTIVVSDGCIHFSAAPEYIGVETCVSGQVDNVFVSRSNTTFINYCTDYRTCPFAAVILADDKNSFSELSHLEGQNVTVNGRIDSYQGRPQIILRDPSQLTVQ